MHDIIKYIKIYNYQLIMIKLQLIFCRTAEVLLPIYFNLLIAPLKPLRFIIIHYRDDYLYFMAVSSYFY